MATVPQRRDLPIDDDLDVSGLPGDQLDVLVATGQLAAAQVEFDRLIQEGVDSGPAAESHEQMMQRLRARLRQGASV